MNPFKHPAMSAGPSLPHEAADGAAPLPALSPVCLAQKKPPLRVRLGSPPASQAASIQQADGTVRITLSCDRRLPLTEAALAEAAGAAAPNTVSGSAGPQKHQLRSIKPRHRKIITLSSSR